MPKKEEKGKCNLRLLFTAFSNILYFPPTHLFFEKATRQVGRGVLYLHISGTAFRIWDEFFQPWNVFPIALFLLVARSLCRPLFILLVARHRHSATQERKTEGFDRWIS
ncbi:hypothetical protein [Methanosarcina siciliae]|uniref:hypothetical protein n=1 Tax=Methanosarcina siciliae TaxID=38027 RepID=UPI000ACF152C|nr:hypothetical protein [Methanosarcina siciliae]